MNTEQSSQTVIVITPADNVATALESIAAGQTIIAGANRPQRNLVPAWNRLGRSDRRRASNNDLAGGNRLERRGHVVGGSDHNRGVH